VPRVSQPGRHKEGQRAARQIKIQVEGEISARTLDYAKRFPKSRKAKTIFAPPPPPPAPAGPPAFATFAREFRERRKVFGSHAYYLDLASLLETHLIPALGTIVEANGSRERLMSEFSIEDVERFVATIKALPGLKGEAMSAVRVNKARNLLRVLLARTVKHGWLAVNPVDDVRRLREDPAEIDPLSWAEVRRLFDKGLKHDPEMQRFYTVAIFTGLRTAELIGLKWGDLDWTSDPPVAVIKSSHTKHDGAHLTKTPGSARAVDLRPPVVRALKAQQTSSRLKSDFVFCSAIGGPLDRDNVNQPRVVSGAQAGGPPRAQALPVSSHVRHARADGRRTHRVGRQADGPRQHRDDHQALLPLHPQPDPAGRLRLREGRRAGRAVGASCTTEFRQKERAETEKGLRGAVP
jgi:integrase